ncbi:hypothetical protein RF11_09867 [Thelohanellus kitauei]|uniref:Uncharacterized protein n=1 Tax=Thelohanellus kitauei TaxID=669202 RepID=A0A0C2JIA7_THEKT|nr:hypothetical protein RF11_09867 [Thelohanellus kitauei]
MSSSYNTSGRLNERNSRVVTLGQMPNGCRTDLLSQLRVSRLKPINTCYLAQSFGKSKTCDLVVRRRVPVVRRVREMIKSLEKHYSVFLGVSYTEIAQRNPSMYHMKIY